MEDGLVTAFVIGSGGVWLALPRAEAISRALDGELDLPYDAELLHGERRHGEPWPISATSLVVP